MIRLLQRLWSLSVDEVLLFLEVLFLLAFMAFSLRRKPLQGILRHLPRATSLKKSLDPYRRKQVVWAVNAAARRFPVFRNCLVQALAVYVLLTRRRVASVLLIGSPMNAETFTAHAWVEVGGLPVFGEPAQHFQVLYSYPP